MLITECPVVYRSVTICYLSGTGNSYRVSETIAEVVERGGVTTSVISVNEANPFAELEDSDNYLLGLVFPTHGFTAPWHMIKFAMRLPRRSSTHAFCVATRAGLRFGKVFIPGISASATLLVAMILALKGYRVRGVTAIDMPSNWYSLHPIQRAESITKIIERATRRTSGFISTMLRGNRYWLTWNIVYDAIFAVALAPISVAYLMYGRFFLAKLFFANSDCDGCGVCSVNCPINAIKMRGRNGRRPYWEYRCESCMRCASLCNKNAIEAGHSWGMLLWSISSFPMTIYLYSFFRTHVPITTGMDTEWLIEPIQYVYMFVSLFASYFLFYLIMKVRQINRVFTWTTLTHLPFWGRYREPGTKLKNLK
jgi:ferredoxin